MTPKTSITVNCPRTHSNLLQIVAEHDGLYLFFLLQQSPDAEPYLIGEGEFMDFNEHPELRDIVTETPFTTYWDTDLLWSIATASEDQAVTPAGVEALDNDELWESDIPDFTNPPLAVEVA